MTPLRLELDNGAVLLLRENHASPSVAFRGSVAAGAAHGEPSESEFVSRLLLRGTRRRSAAKVSRAIEDVGAALSCDTRHEAIDFHGRCTRETLATTLSILVESIAEPAFSATELGKVRGEIVGDLREERDDTRHVAMRRFFRALYRRGHPYRDDPKGDERSVRGVTRSRVRAFHADHVGAQGMVFAFSGDLDEEAFRGTVAEAFGRLDPGSAAPPLSARPGGRVSHATVRMPHKSQADFVVGREAIPRGHPDHYALSLATLLFGRIGLYGRLGARLREELGLAYYSFAVHDARRAGGHWYVSAGVNPGNLAKAAKAIRGEMERLESEPFTDREIRDGKSHMTGAIRVHLERNAEYAAALHDIEYYGLGADYLERFPAIMRRLKGDEVRRKAVEHFDPDRCSWAAAGPVRGIRLSF